MPTPRVRRTPACFAAAALTCAGVAAVGLAPSPAAAACEQQPTVAAAARAADVVFSGTIETSEQVRRAGEQVREVTVEVERVYQGSVGRDLSMVTMPTAVQPRPGAEWFFFADGEGSEFSDVECSGSQVATAGMTTRVEDALGAGEVFVDPAPPQDPLTYDALEVTTLPPLSRLVAPGAGLSLIAVLGLLVTRRRR